MSLYKYVQYRDRAKLDYEENHMTIFHHIANYINNNEDANQNNEDDWDSGDYRFKY